MVGGGGGGGETSMYQGGAGGGGAGGFVYDASHQIPAVPGSYPIIVGNGGFSGKNGSDSSFDTLTAKGGGFGGTVGATGIGSGGNGGSGGGEAYDSWVQGATNGTGVSGQGNSGGTVAWAGSPFGGAGGGGASAAGGNATTTAAKGGDGLANSISGTSVYYAGGGGGGDRGSGGAGGKGGGGAGAAGTGYGTAGNNATPNTGGGGGGDSDGQPGGSGGSGVVIISYPTGTLTATGGVVTTANGRTIHTFRSSDVWTITSVNVGTTSTSTVTISKTTTTATPYTYDPLGNILTSGMNVVAGTSTSLTPQPYPTIMDALPVINRESATTATADTFLYNVPTGGTNKLLVALVALTVGKAAPTATQNGTALTCQPIVGSSTRAASSPAICPIRNPAFSPSAGAAAVRMSTVSLRCRTPRKQIRSMRPHSPACQPSTRPSLPLLQQRQITICFSIPSSAPISPTRLVRDRRRCCSVRVPIRSDSIV